MPLTRLVALAVVGCVSSASSSRTAPIRRAPTPMPPGQHAAQPGQLDGKQHRLEIQFAGPAWDPNPYDEGVTRLLVGADVVLAVPAVLGTGHGPFSRVFPGPGTLAATVTPADAVTVTTSPARPPGEDARIDVRCNRAGVFELAVDVTDADGNHVRDALDLGCIAPTRFAAHDLMNDPGPYLARASTLRVDFTWFGLGPDGQETALVGSLPVTVASGETAIEEVTHADYGPSYHPVRPATSVAWTSGRLTTTMPIEIVEPRTWTLDISFEDSNLRVDSGPALAIGRPHAVDDRGRTLVGITACTMTRSSAGVAAAPEASCTARIIHARALGALRHLHRLYEVADRVCFEVLGQTACRVVPDPASAP